MGRDLVDEDLLVVGARHRLLTEMHRANPTGSEGAPNNQRFAVRLKRRHCALRAERLVWSAPDHDAIRAAMELHRGVGAALCEEDVVPIVLVGERLEQQLSILEPL